MLAGLSAVCLDFGPHAPWGHLGTSFRLLVTGLLFAGAGSLIAISPLGRRSGAHLNPVVTLAFWTQGKVHRHDVAGYLASQLVGAVAGTAVVLAAWGSQARAVKIGATTPGRGVNSAEAVLVEAVMTALLVLAILVMTSSSVTARWTPLVLWLLIAALVWQGAPFTGTSLNPARSLGPALLAPRLSTYWIYVVGPLAGGALAVAAFGLLPTRRVLTAKLFHDPSYPSTMASSLPVAPPPS
jgi:aquaporin Z